MGAVALALSGSATPVAQGGRAGLAQQPVRTGQGLVAGVGGRNATIAVFKGIPFAAPPVGSMRWRAPQPAAPWSGVRHADAFSPSCIQTIVTEKKPWTYEFMAHGEVSEDCLYLNVWTAARSERERRPVFVYIYGGANVEGSASVPAYDGEGLASKGLVVVTFNYRVGLLGFFSHPELSKEAPYHASGNYGLLDQIAAVKWVHDNIAAFGGDPDRITIAGQSAGASAVHNLTASPLAKGLFHRAIAQSGSSIAAAAPRTMQDQEADGLRFAELKGAHSLAELRAMPWQDIVVPLRRRNRR
jgi:para-nitrobenzyl esterase